MASVLDRIATAKTAAAQDDKQNARRATVVPTAAKSSSDIYGGLPNATIWAETTGEPRSSLPKMEHRTAAKRAYWTALVQA